MRLTESLEDGADVLKLIGDVDLYYAPVLRSILRAKARARCSLLILECSEVSLISSCGMAALIEYVRDSRQYAGLFAIVGLRGSVREAFRIVHLDRRVALFNTVVAAKIALTPPAPRRPRDFGSGRMVA